MSESSVIHNAELFTVGTDEVVVTVDRRFERGDGGQDGGDLLGRRVRRHRAEAGGHQSGTFPCLRDGICSRFVRSIANDRARTRRVSRGSITSST